MQALSSESSSVVVNS